MYPLEIQPELCIGPGLVFAGPEVLPDIGSRKEIGEGCLKSQLPVHEQVGPGEVQLISKVLCRIPYLGKDIDALACAVPVVLGIGKVEIGVPDFYMIVSCRSRLEIG